ITPADGNLPWPLPCWPMRCATGAETEAAMLVNPSAPECPLLAHWRHSGALSDCRLSTRSGPCHVKAARLDPEPSSDSAAPRMFLPLRMLAWEEAQQMTRP